MSETGIDRKKYIKVGIYISLVVIAFWIASFFIVRSLGIQDPPGLSSGEIGDMFGAINALFSGLAFVGLIVTIWMQSEELHYTRREYAKTVQALKDQATNAKSNLELNRLALLEEKKPFIVIESPDSSDGYSIYKCELYLKTLNHQFRIIDWDVLGTHKEYLKVQIAGKSDQEYYPIWVFPDTKENYEYARIRSIRIKVTPLKSKIPDVQFLDFRINLRVQDSNGNLYNSILYPVRSEGFPYDEDGLVLTVMTLSDDYLVLTNPKAFPEA